jgi:hypothetical protein
MTAKAAPYGSWKSPISAAVIAEGGIGLGGLTLDGEDVYWIEMRPSESGRNVLVRWTEKDGTQEVLPKDVNVRTRVHEYGGGAYLAHHGTLFFSNYKDQRLYRQDPGGQPYPLTPDVNLRYANAVFDNTRGCLYLVREDHTGDGEAVNTIVRLPASCEAGRENAGTIVAEGYSFYSDPRLNPHGTHLCWLCWNHPNMPWDGCELWVGELDKDGDIVHHTKVAGGIDESIFQPRWSPDGDLYFVSDRSGWWNLYRWEHSGSVAIYPKEAEFGLPQWVFGQSTYDFESRRRLACTWVQGGETHLELLDLVSDEVKPFHLPYTELDYIQADYGYIYALAGSPSEPWSIIRIQRRPQKLVVLRSSRKDKVDPAYMPEVEPILCP